MGETTAAIPCSEAVRQLWDYLDHAIAPDDQKKVEHHLSFCRRCCGELEFAKEIRRFLASGSSEGGSGRREAPPRAIRRGAIAMAKDRCTRTRSRTRSATRTARSPSGAGDIVAERLYSEEELTDLPTGARDWALGVGNPVRYAFLQAGEVVLDIGSGGGIDTILAARRVGPTGKAIGLDIVDAMVDRARLNAAEAGVDRWTEFLPGEMEQIPLPDASVDVVISNGVLNLSHARAARSRRLTVC